MPLQPATNPLYLTTGVLIPEDDAYDVSAVSPTGTAGADSYGELPPGMFRGTNPGRVWGTPTTAGTYEPWWDAGWSEEEMKTVRFGLEIIVEDPAPEPVTAAAPVFDDDALTVTIPESPGAAYSVNGVDVPAGAHAYPAGTAVTVLAVPVDAGYVLEGDTEWAHTFPEADTGPDPVDLLTEDPETMTVRAALAPRVVKHTAGLEDPAATELASAHVGVVLEYVRGFTRGRGFHGMIPERDLQAVIVAASARLFTNPEQVASFTLGDYSERPAVLAGWTMAEMGVLRRHRRTYR